MRAPASHNQSITPELVAEHGFKGDEYDRLLSILGREPSVLLDDRGRLGASPLQVIVQSRRSVAPQRECGVHNTRE